jgi:hypothetical protein
MGEMKIRTWKEEIGTSVKVIQTHEYLQLGYPANNPGQRSYWVPPRYKSGAFNMTTAFVVV